MIHGGVRASKPKTMQDAIEFLTKLMDKKISTPTEWNGEKKHYGGSKPLCSKCNYHHDGPCSPKCHKCNRVGHLAYDFRSFINANTTNNQRGTGASQKATCYECKNQGHYRNDCLERKNQNHENQTRGTEARGMVVLARVTTRETEDKSKEKRLEDVLTIRDFPKVFPEDLLGLPTTRQVEISDQYGTWCCICSTGALSISVVRNQKFVGATAGTTRQRLYKTQFLTLGSSSHVCQEEGWTISNVHRLSRTEQADEEESLPTPKDRRFV
ncbi:reverse transcriptase domain-containing protein [Tanacetum coccineum]